MDDRVPAFAPPWRDHALLGGSSGATRRTLAPMSPSPVHPTYRVPLPFDASDLPGLGPDAARVLDEGLRVMDIRISPSTRAALDAHARLLAAWGRHINLTAIREPTDVIRLHVLDSLSAVEPIRARLGAVGSVVDIGSGGGYPGIPAGLGLEATRISLVESVGRKARFLEVAGAAVGAAYGERGAPIIETLAVRAEALASDEHRGTWDVATVRAVGSVGECAELGLPLLRTGGLLACWKRDGSAADGAPAHADVGAEVGAARALIGLLGGGEPEVVPAGVPGSPGHRLVLITKERATPRAFPRPPMVRRRAERGQGRRS